MIKLTSSLSEEYKLKNLCMAGGVALNCVANGKILKKNIFDNIWIQPASGDAGGSLGACLAFWYKHLKKNRVIDKNDSMQGSLLGPEYKQNDIEEKLTDLGAKFETFNLDELINKTVSSIINGDAVGWFQGRMEFGPRALGSRSILGDPRSEKMQKNLNLKVKYRESFRPFAPSILEDDLENWFDIKIDSPYMLMVGNVSKNKSFNMSEEEKKLFGIEKLNTKRSEIPAVTHVDYSARIQTVNFERNKLYYKLISEFKKKTGCPILINTSFNIRGEPIVCTPAEAFKCFMGTEMDTLVIGNCFLKKDNQNKNLLTNYRNQFELD